MKKVPESTRLALCQSSRQVNTVSLPVTVPTRASRFNSYMDIFESVADHAANQPAAKDAEFHKCFSTFRDLISCGRFDDVQFALHVASLDADTAAENASIVNPPVLLGSESDEQTASVLVSPDTENVHSSQQTVSSNTISLRTGETSEQIEETFREEMTSNNLTSGRCL
jgi:hypothetical protein